ncbi:MAG TPA: phage holin family protein [Candidatus Deferrimicrobiaceae bacterium]|nr:phage holin family protein [Candidatus Deferrimicrobiaceae bacterium]
MSVLRRLVAFYGLQVRLLRTWRTGARALVTRFVLTTAIAFVSFGSAIAVVPGIQLTGGIPSVLAAVFLIGVLNAMLRPVALAAAVPLGVLAVALLAVALQFAIVLLAGVIVPGLSVSGWTAAVEGALVFAVVNASIGWFVALREDDSYYAHLIRSLIRRTDDIGRLHEPGVVFVQIDGLARPILLNQIRAGRVPTLARWLRSGSHRITPWTCRLPSQTSASQAGILFGQNDGIPAFRWYEKSSGRLLVSNRPADAAEIERRLSRGNGLLRGGASIGNMFSGDAAESILTMSQLSAPEAALGPARSWYYFFISPFALARAVFLTLGEAVKEVWQARRQAAAGIEPRIRRGGSYPLLRGITNVLLRQISVSLVAERMLRGLPVIYVDFTDYDEIAHHAGPERGEALDALDGVDHVIGALAQVAIDAPRPYRFVVLSDHGQSLGATFRQRYGATIGDLLRDLTGRAVDVRRATATVEAWGPVNVLLSELTRTRGVSGRVVGRALRSRSRGGVVELGPSTSESADVDDRREAAGRSADDIVVCASGNLALVYFTTTPTRLTLEAIAERHPALLPGLAGHPGIGFVLVHSEQRGPVVLGPAGVRHLASDRVDGEDPLAPFGPTALDDLRRLDAMANVGDLVLNSRLDRETGEVAAFEELVGSHGGLGGWQTDAFVLHPADWPTHGETDALVGATAVHELLAAGLRTVREAPVSAGQPANSSPRSFSKIGT